MISKELQAHGLADANLADVVITEEMLNGTSLQPGFPSYYQAVPALRVYEFFIPYTVEEIQAVMGNEQ